MFDLFEKTATGNELEHSFLGWSFDVSADGNRFLIMMPIGAADVPPPLTMLVNCLQRRSDSTVLSP
jgi:hypothetical protein